MARGSLTKSKDHLLTVLDCKYISQDQLDIYIIEYESCHRLLNGYINYLKKMKKAEAIFLNEANGL